MDITGKIIVALPEQGGVSQRTGNSWKSQDFVIETMEQYPRKCVFRVFGEDRLREFALKVGETVTVSMDVDAHEYNGRWFNDIRAWRVQRGNPAEAAQPAAVPPAVADIPAPQPEEPASSNDDLPF
ncbi:MAG: DUF3127 domain-containing protein [Alloprevotella sp.]